MHCYGNYESRKKDTDEPDQKGDQSSERGYDNNIAIADGQSCNEGKIQRVCKGFSSIMLTAAAPATTRATNARITALTRQTAEKKCYVKRVNIVISRILS